MEKWDSNIDKGQTLTWKKAKSKKNISSECLQNQKKSFIEKNCSLEKFGIKNLIKGKVKTLLSWLNDYNLVFIFSKQPLDFS